MSDLHQRGVGYPYASAAASPSPWQPSPWAPQRTDERRPAFTAHPVGAPAPFTGWTPPSSSAPPWPAQWAPGAYPPPGRPRRTSRTYAIVGVAAAAVAMCAVVAVIVTGSTPSQPAPQGSDTTTAPASPSLPPPSPAPTIAVNALTGLLPDPAAINAIMGTSAMVLVPDPAPDKMWTADIDRPDCLGTYHPAELANYQGSGWIAVQTQMLREPGENWTHSVSQAVISFASAQAATDFASQQGAKWQRCMGVAATVTDTTSHERYTFTVDRVDNQNGTLTARFTYEGLAGWGCQRALTAHNNVVIDVRACSDAPTDQAAKIAASIAGRAA
ncbi:sensor domain-containing protein [Mycobacterium sp. 050128]|uniref:sensor domain-containing protein n=1 Tax=unclassified Mycobacterium TaxID=2642494 RepID=UPI002ED8BF30